MLKMNKLVLISLCLILLLALLAGCTTVWAKNLEKSLAEPGKEAMTVLGPVDVSKLGSTLAHGHLTLAVPGFYLDDSLYPYDSGEIYDECLATFMNLKKLGVNTWVDATPIDNAARDPAMYKKLSLKQE